MFHGNLLRKSHDPVENDLGNIHKRWRLDSKQISAIASHLFFPPIPECPKQYSAAISAEKILIPPEFLIVISY